MDCYAHHGQVIGGAWPKPVASTDALRERHEHTHDFRMPRPNGALGCSYPGCYLSRSPSPEVASTGVLHEQIAALARVWDEESVEPPEDFADALLDLLAANRDAVLDALGLEQVARHRRRDGWLHGRESHGAACAACEPLYRLRSVSDVVQEGG
jgi:hypothetical protein